MNAQRLQPQVESSFQKPGKSRRGFASMNKDRHKLVSSKGGTSSRQQSPTPEKNLKRTSSL